jgi:hypothetical protein
VREMKRFCDEDCNNCKIIGSKNSRQLTYVLNKLHDEFGTGVYTIVQEACPNMTVCFDCRIDDFCHSNDCELIKESQ